MLVNSNRDNFQEFVHSNWASRDSVLPIPIDGAESCAQIHLAGHQPQGLLAAFITALLDVRISRLEGQEKHLVQIASRDHEWQVSEKGREEGEDGVVESRVLLARDQTQLEQF